MRIRILVIVMGILVLCQATISAQEQQFDEAEYLQAILANVRVPALTDGVCHLHDRYVAISVLDERVQKNHSLLAILKASLDEIEQLRAAAAYDLAKVLTNHLRHGWPFVPACVFEARGQGVRYVHPLWHENKQDIAKYVVRMREDNPELNHGYYWSSEEVADRDELREIIIQYAAEQGPKIRDQWLKEKRGLFSSSSEIRLQIWLMDDKIAPSVIGLTACQAGQILEAIGRKPTEQFVRK